MWGWKCSTTLSQFIVLEVWRSHRAGEVSNRFVVIFAVKVFWNVKVGGWDCQPWQYQSLSDMPRPNKKSCLHPYPNIPTMSQVVSQEKWNNTDWIWGNRGFTAALLHADQVSRKPILLMAEIWRQIHIYSLGVFLPRCLSKQSWKSMTWWANESERERVREPLKPLSKYRSGTTLSTHVMSLKPFLSVCSACVRQSCATRGDINHCRTRALLLAAAAT